jgi:hypothetical protein
MLRQPTSGSEVLDTRSFGRLAFCCGFGNIALFECIEKGMTLHLGAAKTVFTVLLVNLVLGNKVGELVCYPFWTAHGKGAP